VRLLWLLPLLALGACRGTSQVKEDGDPRIVAIRKQLDRDLAAIESEKRRLTAEFHQKVAKLRRAALEEKGKPEVDWRIEAFERALRNPGRGKE